MADKVIELTCGYCGGSFAIWSWEDKAEAIKAEETECQEWYEGGTE
jgi:hypothetical protein